MNNFDERFKGTIFDPAFNLKSLIAKYRKHGKIIVAYDFDDTVYVSDEQASDEACALIRELLVECSKYPDDIAMVCYTCRDGDTIKDEVIPFLDEHRIRYDKINENMDNVDDSNMSDKLVFSIFLDNLAGCGEAYSTLSRFIVWLMSEKGVILDKSLSDRVHRLLE